mgnify:CR=1 FL=1
MATATMEFAKPIAELARQIEELKSMAGARSLNVTASDAPLDGKLWDRRDGALRPSPAPAPIPALGLGAGQRPIVASPHTRPMRRP